MIRSLAILLSTVVLFGSSHARASEPDLSALAHYYKNGELDVERLKRDYERQAGRRAARPASKAPPIRQAETSAAVSVVETVAPVLPVDEDKKPIDCIENKPEGPFRCLLRRNFTDIFLFDQITPRQDAVGAEIAYTRDTVANDTLWSTHAMGSVVYRAMGSNGGAGYPSFVGLSVAPYLQIDREIHSNRKLRGRNVDLLTVGGSGEVGFRLLGGQHFLRGRVAAVSDQIADATYVRGIAEWFPVYKQCINYPCAFGPLVFNFQPELKLQYDRVSGQDSLLSINNEEEALRIGPEFTVLVRPYPFIIPPELSVLRSVFGRFTYHWSQDVVTNRRFTWLDASLVYNIDPEGFLAVAASYRRGNEEETGERVGVFRISLTGKI